MTTSTLAFGKANVSGQLKLTERLYRGSLTGFTHVRSYGNGNGSRSTDAAFQRELVLDVLNANATKRDAKQFLARVKLETKAKSLQHRLPFTDRLDRTLRGSAAGGGAQPGINLGDLYGPTRAITQTPQFTEQRELTQPAISVREDSFVALVCLKSPDKLDSETLRGVALTLSQLVKLNTRILAVLDCAVDISPGGKDGSALKLHKTLFEEEARRLSAALAEHGAVSGRAVASALQVISDDPSSGLKDRVSVELPNLLLDPLRRGVIPIVSTLAHTELQKQALVNLSDVMQALISMLASPSIAGSEVSSVDRIIVLDDLGGIPSKVRGDGSHVFINLEQEYDDIVEELSQYDKTVFSKQENGITGSPYSKHLSNIAMLRDCLALLPSESSALIVTPYEAASSSQSSARQIPTLGAGTRRQKNTLIHNILTNKPGISSSLPVARMPSTAAPTCPGNSSRGLPAATLVKRGMPLVIIPHINRGDYWHSPASGKTHLSLDNDPRINLERLVHLIDQSFRRKLDVRDYLNRIRNRVAGLIIAGDYEGGAILTWEAPPGVDSPARLVPYLDKFAVLPSSQGSSGVADIVFQAMVRTCFPDGVCWRSRRDNPVNKWYFERSHGSWDIPGSNWTMFWTGEGVVDDPQRWEDYVAVCRSIQASWADQKPPD